MESKLHLCWSCASSTTHQGQNPAATWVLQLQNPDRPQWHLPLSDPTFHELCASKPVASSRGYCYFLKRRKIVRCLPSFLVVGFTKSGTSAFFQYVAQHHQIRTARIKEPAFLGSDVEAAAQNGTALEDAMDGSLVVPGDATRVIAAPAVKTLRWYLNLFPPCAQCERGEATPSYAWRDFSAVAAVQARLLLGGDIKLIMLVREPIERAASHYVYFREKRRAFRNGNLSFVLRGALDEFERCAAGWADGGMIAPTDPAAEQSGAAAAVRQTRPELWRLKNKASYELLQAGLYVEHLRTWRAQFPESMLVLDSALLLTAPLRAMRRFEKHLGVPPSDAILAWSMRLRRHVKAAARPQAPQPGRLLLPLSTPSSVAPRTLLHTVQPKAEEGDGGRMDLLFDTAPPSSRVYVSVAGCERIRAAGFICFRCFPATRAYQTKAKQAQMEVGQVKRKRRTAGGTAASIPRRSPRVRARRERGPSGEVAP